MVEQSSNTDQSSQEGLEQQQSQQPNQEPEALKLPDFDSNPNLLKLDYEFDYIFNMNSGEGISDFL